MATLNTAEYFGLHDRGAISPGRRADLVVFDNFVDLHVRQVYRGGQLVAEDGRFCGSLPEQIPVPLRSSMNVDWSGVNLRVPVLGKRMRVIGLVPGQIVTRRLVEAPTVRDGIAVTDPGRDLLKLAVVERHLASGRVGLGFVKGFGLKRGAIASSVAHDSHNIIVVGVGDDDMMAAIRAVVGMRGGIVAVADGRTLASLPLPIAGLMSDQPIEIVRDQQLALAACARDLGCSLPDPLMALSFLALPVIPELKLTDMGLVDVTQFRVIPLFEG
jgi:adenine deaminase